MICVQSQKSTHEEEDYDTFLLKLQSHLLHESPDKKVTKNLMKKTFLGRFKWIAEDLPTVYDVLDVFPPLKEIKYVRFKLVINNKIILLFDFNVIADL